MGFTGAKKLVLILSVIFTVCLSVFPAYAETNHKRPLVLVPGLGASWNWQKFMDIPLDKWTWAPGAQPIYQGLIRRLNAAGYTQANGYLTIAYYDWRNNLNNGATQLDRQIATVKQKTGAQKVDLISHSMGGLVARAYIQSDAYDNDVGKLVTLGTPHLGLPVAYFPWEGAEAYGWDKKYDMIFKLYIQIYGQRYGKVETIKTVQKIFPGLHDLLPVYPLPPPPVPGPVLMQKLFSPAYAVSAPPLPFLINAASGAPIYPVATTYAYNTTLIQLYLTADKLFHRTEDLLNIVGTGRDSMVRVFVTPNTGQNPLYPDGIPDKARTGFPDDGVLAAGESTDGDGTVANISALAAPFNSRHTYSVNGVDHTALPNNLTVHKEIFHFLGIGWVEIGAINPINGDILAVYAASPVALKIISPTGKLLNREINQIAGAEYLVSGGDSPVTIAILPAQAGTYQLALTGIGQGAYHLGSARFSKQGATNWVEEDGNIRPGQVDTYRLSLSGASSTPAAALVSTLPPASRVVINEIMWMGTPAATSAEWLELYNVSARPVDLASWSIYGANSGHCLNFAAADGSFSTIIPAGGFLIYGNSPTAVQDRRGASLVAIYDRSILLNDRHPTQLVLYDAPDCAAGNGREIDRVHQTRHGWFAGKKNPDYSMERIDPAAGGAQAANWQTNNGGQSNGYDAQGNQLHATPGRPNSASPFVRSSTMKNNTITTGTLSFALLDRAGQKLGDYWFHTKAVAETDYLQEAILHNSGSLPFHYAVQLLHDKEQGSKLCRWLTLKSRIGQRTSFAGSVAGENTEQSSNPALLYTRKLDYHHQERLSLTIRLNQAYTAIAGTGSSSSLLSPCRFKIAIVAYQENSDGSFGFTQQLVFANQVQFATPPALLSAPF